MKLLRYSLALILGAASASLLFTGGTLMLVAGTTAGRVIGAMFLLGSIAISAEIFALCAPTRRGRRPFRRLALISFITLGCAFATLLHTRGGGSLPPDESGLKSSWAGGSQPFGSRVLSLLPEVDAVKIASAFAPYIDRETTPDEAANVEAAIQHTYFEMQADPTFLAAPGALAYAIEGAIGGKQTGHTFTFLPPFDEGISLPIILILHDSPANLKAALWPWRPWSEHGGYIVSAPTCGNGQWAPEDTRAAISLALRELNAFPGAKIDDITLVTVGTAVRAIPECLDLLKTDVTQIVTISPSEFGADLVAPISGKRLLVLHGGTRDTRISFAELQKAVEPLHSPGDVTVTMFPNAGRFLLLTQGEAATAEVASWLAERPGD